jgi:DNA topoisomerase-1
VSPVGVPALRYTAREELSLHRVRRGRGFSYHDGDGGRIADDVVLERIRGLAIPPAWTDVVISADADSHLQAVGRDQRGRLQYRYHPDWTAFRDRLKFDHLPAFAGALPAVRRRVDADLRLPGVPREKVLAAVVELLQTTLIRVGNDEYARDNGAYGLTTLRNRHARVDGAEIVFVFAGKSGVRHEVHAHDRRVAKVLRDCQEIAGQRLFQYLDDDGAPASLHSHDVNDYLREASGVDITAKDFRTWVATVATATTLGPLDPPSTPAEEKAMVKEAIAAVSCDLGNTPAVCRASYVHPRVLEAFGSGVLHEVWSATPPRRARLTVAERRTVVVLKHRRRAGAADAAGVSGAAGAAEVPARAS